MQFIRAGAPLGYGLQLVPRGRVVITTQRLTEEQFAEAEDTLDALFRSSKLGSTKRAIAEREERRWRSILAMPQTTWQQRQDREQALYAIAHQVGLVKS